MEVLIPAMIASPARYSSATVRRRIAMPVAVGGGTSSRSGLATRCVATARRPSYPAVRPRGVISRSAASPSSSSPPLSFHRLLTTPADDGWPGALLPREIRARGLSSLPAPSEESSPRTTDDDARADLEPIEFATSSRISGEESQILEVRLRPNQMLRAESGAMLYMTSGVTMETSMGLGRGGSGGLQAGLTRMMTGQNLMVSDFAYSPPDESSSSHGDGHGTVALGTDFPAKILKFDLSEYPERKLVCQKGSFLAGSHTVAMEMAYTKNFTSGFFGGEGFILQSLCATADHGGETAFLKAYGTVVKKELKAGQTLRVSSGSLICMTSTIDYDVTTMPGFKNVMFGGEGLFVTTLSGPGTVWLQGMPIDRMVSEIARKVPSGGGIGLGIPIGVGGGGEAGDSAGDVPEPSDSDATGAGGGVPITDAAVEDDRNSMVASSGAGVSDPESPESLFGDAAYGGDGVSDRGENSLGDSEDGTHFLGDEFSRADDVNMPEFEEPSVTEEQFEDDGTTFSMYEGDGSSEGGSAETPTSDDEGPGLLSQLWDMFNDINDD